MKKAMRSRSKSPPLHVHVRESTPVHLHVTNQRKSSKSPQKSTNGYLHLAKRTPTEDTSFPATARVKSWIPPGKPSTPKAYKWESTTHRLDITPSVAPLRREDLSTDDDDDDDDEEEEEEEGPHDRLERRINSLMSEVSSLKSEVELQKKEKLLQHKSEHRSASQHVFEEQEEEELDLTERVNSRLRQSIDKMQEETDHARLERQELLQEKDSLLRKLVEAEVDGVTAATQVSSLTETLGQIRSEPQLSGSEATLLTRQKELLLQKLENFEGTNCTLQNLLREHQGREEEVMLLSEQKDSLLKKLGNVEAENRRLLEKLEEKKDKIDQLTNLLDNEKDNAKTTSELSKALESTRAHLQGQLRNKEAENNRLTMQIRNLESSAILQQGEMERTMEQLREAKQRAEADKEALKRAARAQKQRAEQSEEAAAQLSVQMHEKESQLAEAISTAESWNNMHSQLLKEKSKMEVELNVLSSQVKNLTEHLHGMEGKAQTERENLMERLHNLTPDYTAVRLENQNMKSALITLEEKLSLSQSEVKQMSATVKQYESLVDSYKTQVQKTRQEADEYCRRLEVAEKEARVLQEELEREVEAARTQLHPCLSQLETLPEALRQAELRLQEARERGDAQERKNMELNSALTEMRVKVEQQNSHVAVIREKNLVLLEENKHLQNRVDTLERKLEETNSQNHDLLQVITNREEVIQSHQQRLEEKSRECSNLSRQLEDALDNARRQISFTRERAVAKERSILAKVVDLETELIRTKAEFDHLRRSKEEAERRYQSRLQDVRDRLEQSDSTNRSMQNYVQFLKASYANVFGDPLLSSSALRPPSPL